MRSLPGNVPAYLIFLDYYHFSSQAKIIVHADSQRLEFILSRSLLPNRSVKNEQHDESENSSCPAPSQIEYHLLPLSFERASGY